VRKFSDRWNCHKTQTESDIVSVNQGAVNIREQLGDTVGDCNSGIQAERKVFQAEIQKVTTEMGNLKARFSSRQLKRSTSANNANIGQDQIVRVYVMEQGSECPATSLSDNTSNNSGLNGLSVCVVKCLVVTVLLIVMCNMGVLTSSI
jgi:hypothetical protein